MKATQQYLLVLFLAVSLATGCYKDKGNYDYTAINQVSITADTPNDISVLLQDTLRINTTLTQTIPSSAGFSYEWVLFQSIAAPLTRWPMGTSKDLKVQVTQPPGQYVLDYFVKDKTTGVEFRKRFNISIVGKFNEGWLVLEETDANNCDLAMITPIDAVFKDIYSSANAGAKLPAGSHRVTVVRDRTGVQKIYVLSPNELTQPYFADFLKVASFNDLFWGAPSVKKPQTYFINTSDEVMINNGYPHGMTTNAPAPYKLGLQPAGTWDLEPYEIYTTVGGYIFYDKLSQRFLKYNLTDLLPFAAPPPTAVFNANNVGKKMLFTGASTGNFYNCVFKNNTNDSVFVFKLDGSAAQPAADTAYIPNSNAPGLFAATKFISSKLLPHLYYVSNNVVYLLDIPARQARVVYTFPAGAVVTSMKLYVNTKVSTDPDNNKLIGISTTEGGAGKVYTFPIAATGDFTGNTYRKLYTGFGKINDIVFKSAP